ncbi:MAG TPA: RNA polymerase sigma-70 factor [Parapedobacter sp.]|nr:RNA polymerase sigma-70 factor [Parapedobacter sp.]
MSARIEVAAELIAHLKKGKETAFRKIYEQLHRPVYRTIHTLVKDTEKTEELVQEAFVALWSNRSRLHEDQPLYPYVYLTAKRLAIDHFRNTLREARAMDYLKNTSSSITHNTEESIAASELQRFTEETVKQLPTQQQTVFMLSRHEGLSYDEIAQRLQISPNTVRNHMVCALKAIKLHFIQGGFVSLFVAALTSCW